MKLTDATIKNLKPEDKPKKYSDGGGLYLHVYPTGSKLWQMAYRFNGKGKTLSFGAYPAIGLKDARDKREDAKKLLANGVDPGEHKKAVQAAIHAESQNTFEVIAREWYNKQEKIWAKSHAVTVIAKLTNYVFPLLGSKPINTITAPALLEVIRRIEAKGTIETAHRTMQVCGQVFRYAIATGRTERNITADLRGALTPIKSGNFASITDPKEIGHLLRDIDNYNGNIVIKAALRLMPYVFVRSGELRGAEWTEIDFDKAEWRIPASRMKMKVEHIVPLSNQAVEILKELRPYTSHSKYIFPSLRAKTLYISDVALLNALRQMGYDKETMTIHGFRHMASTRLNNHGYNGDWIEMQLAHSERNKSRKAYNQAEYLSMRRRMMQEYADYLDRLKADRNNKVIPLRVSG